MSTIVCATSGDTGGAAVEAFRGAHNVDIVVLFPEGRVSPVQRRQMTTIDSDNVRDPIVGFIYGSKGLMYNLTFEGSKITRIAR